MDGPKRLLATILIGGMIYILLQITGYINTSHATNQKPIISATTTTAYIVVEKKILMELIEDARKQGGQLNVVAYVYNDVTGTWNRASTLCNKEGEK